MTTASTAFAAIRTLLESNPATNPKSGGGNIPFRWRGDKTTPLPNTPSPFVFTLFGVIGRSEVIEIGGGLGSNRWRNACEANVFVFIPKEWTQTVATDVAEHFAGLFRPFSGSGVNIDTVTVDPGGAGSEINIPGVSQNEAGNYMWSACGVTFYFDTIG